MLNRHRWRPDRSESANSRVAEPGAVNGHKVTTAVAIYKGERTDAPSDLDPSPSLCQPTAGARAHSAACRCGRADAWHRRACRLARHCSASASCSTRRKIRRRAKRRIQGHHRATERRHRRAQGSAGRRLCKAASTAVDAPDERLDTRRTRAGGARREGRETYGNRRTSSNVACRSPACRRRRLPQPLRRRRLGASRQSGRRHRLNSDAAPHAPDARTCRACPSFTAGCCNGSSMASPIIHSREGMIEVGVGAALPGGGRVEDIRRQDGRWVVVTSRGLVMMR